MQADEQGTHLPDEGFQSSCKAPLAQSRCWVLTSKQQIWVAEVYLHCLTCTLLWLPVTYNDICTTLEFHYKGDEECCAARYTNSRLRGQMSLRCSRWLCSDAI